MRYNLDVRAFKHSSPNFLLGAYERPLMLLCYATGKYTGLHHQDYKTNSRQLNMLGPLLQSTLYPASRLVHALVAPPSRCWHHGCPCAEARYSIGFFSLHSGTLGCCLVDAPNFRRLQKCAC